MKKIIFIAIFLPAIISCRKAKEEPLMSSAGQRLENIKIIDLQSSDTTLISMNYDGELLKKINSRSPTFIQGFDEQGYRFYSEKEIEYEGDNIRSITTSWQNSSQSDPDRVYLTTERFEYIENLTKTYEHIYSWKGAGVDSTTKFTFFYSEEPRTLNYILRKNPLTVVDMQNPTPTETDTLWHAPPQDIDVISMFVILNHSAPEHTTCPEIAMFEFKWFKNFSFTEHHDCKKTYEATGTYTGAVNLLPKPVWDALTTVVSGLEPVRGLIKEAFYRKGGAPKYFVLNLSDGTSTFSYEYLTDSSGNILYIKEKKSGVDSKIIQFEYESL